MIHPTVGPRRLRAVLTAACALAALAAPAVGALPARAQEGAAAVQDVTLSDVTLPLGGTLLKAPKLVASGTRLSKDDLAAILRADSPEPWATRLARLDAGSLTIPVLTSEHAGPGDARQTVTYRDVVARDVRAGQIGELTAAGATIAVTGGAGRGSGTYGLIRTTGLDLAALSRLYTVPGDGKGPVQKVYGTLYAADVTYSDAAGTTVKIAQLDGRDLGGRQVPGGWNGAFDALTAGLARPNEPKGFAGPAADLIAASSLGSLEVRGLSLSNAGPQEPLLIEIGRIAYAESGPAAGTSLEALSLARGPLRARLGRLAVSGVSLAPTVAGLRSLAAQADPDSGIGEDAMRRLAPALGSLTLSDLSIDLPPEPALPGKDPRKEVRAAANGRPAGEVGPADPLAAAAPPPRVSLREAALGFGPAQDGVPNSSRLSLSGLSLPAGLVAGMPVVGALPTYGYRDLDLDLVADATWDEAGRALDMREVALTGRDIGSLRLAGTLGGIGPEIFSGSVPASTMLLFSGSAKTLDLTVENAGLFERFLAVQSKDLSLKPDELRKEYVTASLLGVPVILGNTPAAKAIGAAMGQFVMKPGKLVLRAKSKEPAGIGFIELGAARSPAAVLDRLDVEAKAN